ncbi:3644_t:CDS:2, partial [Racocetra persica]
LSVASLVVIPGGVGVLGIAAFWNHCLLELVILFVGDGCWLSLLAVLSFVSVFGIAVF